ncbi:hypothetical protein QFC22_003793 [Naganishia vaughanmartiniae]|uniref:Uncharacterized protein n=1 Tax=Naganishia vaughanmartiniae TaxID=1424756 RepID=A0ACC2X473_9TREE|nr:hypothetical protein QFC22_003793 [Naganishia vaughanmartiniae]
MSKPSLTIITTPASAPTTRAPSPVQEEGILPAASGQNDSNSLERHPSFEDTSEGEEGGAQGSPATEEHVGTPGFTQNSIPANGEPEPAKAWTSTISTSESMPYGIKLPPIPDQTTLQNLTETRSSTPIKSPQTGFKAFLRRTFGIGKGSSEKEQKKGKTYSPSPVTGTNLRQQKESPVISGPPPTIRQASGRASPVVQARSPPPLAAPVFSPVSPSANVLSSMLPMGQQQNTLGVVCQPADIPLPPSPFIGQDSPKMPSAGRIVSNGSIGPSEMEAHHPTTAITDIPGTDSASVLSPAQGPTPFPEEASGVIPSLPKLATDATQEGPSLAGTTSSTSRASPGRAGEAYDYNQIMSAIEPQHAAPFSTSPITTSHINGGPGGAAGTTAELHGGVTMSRSVTAEGIGEAKDIMDEKRSMLQEASDNLAALASRHGVHRSADSQEEAEAMDSVPADLGFRPRAGQQARKVSPTPSVPKYGRSVSAPGNDRLAPPPSGGVVNAKDGFGRNLSIKGGASSGTGLTRSGSKLRTSVYGLSDVLHRKDTTPPKQKRISISPTMHTMGSIMKEANEIMDQDERDRAESFFMS